MRSPKQLYALLDKKVAGQHDVKKALSLAVYNHCVAANMYFQTGVNAKLKNNLLIVGPTGCGKTYMMESLGEFIRYPVFHINALEITGHGWKGNGIEDHLSNLADKCKSYYSADTWQHAFENAIVFIDELDKLCRPSISSAGTDHNKTAQFALLKAIEGTTLYLETDTFKKRSAVSEINTRNMMFVFGGNFEEVRKELNKHNNKQSIGFVDTASSDRDDLSVIHKELMKAGMAQEFAGRIATIVEVQKLTRAEYRQALLNPVDGALMPYMKIYRYQHNCDMTISNYYINKIIDICEKSEIGARGLHTAIEQVLREVMYNTESYWDNEIESHEPLKKTEDKGIEIDMTGLLLE